MKGGGLLLLFVVVCGCLGLFSGAEAQKEDVLFLSFSFFFFLFLSFSFFFFLFFLFCV